MLVATASRIGDRTHQCDAVASATGPDGTTAVALIDGIGSDDDIAATAPLLAEVAARVGARRGALAGLLAAGELISSGTADLTRPNAVGALAVVYPNGETVVAHCGDVRAHSWNGRTIGMMTTDHTMFQLLLAHVDREDRKYLDTLRYQDRRGSLGDLDDHVRTTLARATVSSIVTTSTTDPLLVLTSDGVHSRMSSDDIALFIDQNEDHPQVLADLLVESAHQGLPARDRELDNATAVVIRIADKAPPAGQLD